MNKKGNFPDVAEWIVLALALALVLGIVLSFISGFDSRVQSMNESVVPDNVKAGSASLLDSFYKGGDFLFVMVFVAFVGFSVMAARLIPSSPKFVIIAIFAIIVLPFVAMIVENVWYGFFQQATMGVVYGNMVVLPYVMNHLTVFTLFYSIAVGIALLSKDGGINSYDN